MQRARPRGTGNNHLPSAPRISLGKPKRKKPFAECPTLSTRQKQTAQPAVTRYGLFAEGHMPVTRHIVVLPSAWNMAFGI